jgi:hypothetical protein
MQRTGVPAGKEHTMASVDHYVIQGLATSEQFDPK